MKKIVGVLLGALGLVLGVTSFVPASAAIAYLTISAPTNVPFGWTGPIRVTGSADGCDESWTLTVSDDDYDYYRQYTYSACNEFDYTIDTEMLQANTTYTLYAEDSNRNYLDSAAITVGAPPLTLNGSQAATTFYPTVRDGFKDQIGVRYRTNRDARVAVAVYNSSGRVVKTANAGVSRAGNTRRYEWGGKKNDGKPVSVGRYRIKLTATTAGQTVSKTFAVKAVSDVVDIRKRIMRDGHQWSAKSVRGNCYIRSDSYEGEATLDCWGGRHAETVYRIKVPRNAKIERMWIRGEVNCCESGRLTRTIQRVSPTLVVAKVRVTSWRSYTVWDANVKYSYPRQR